MSPRVKYCSRCGKSKPLEDFYAHQRNKDGLYSWCKSCQSDDNKIKYEARKHCPRQKEYSRRASLKRLYGLTLEQYNDILEKQEFRCIICKKHQDDSKQNFSVDHNHQTGEIRGLACTFCNHRIIGSHKDPDLLRRVADYLEQGIGLFVPDEFKGGPKRRRRRKKSI